MIILRTKNYSYHTEISKVIRKQGKNLGVLDRARVTDALEGVVERSRRRQARTHYLRNTARNNTLGSTASNKVVSGGNTAQRQAETLALRNTFNNREEELIRKRARRLEL